MIESPLIQELMHEYLAEPQDHEFAQALMELDNPRHEAALLEAERSSCAGPSCSKVQGDVPWA